MKISTMRRIDEFVGVPICAALSLAARCRAPQIAHLEQVERPKILIIHLSEMGAFVVAQPALQDLRRRLPQAEIFYMVFPPIDCLISELNLADNEHIFAIQKDKLGRLASSTLSALHRLRSLHIDAVINGEGFSRFAAILAYMSCPDGVRVGFHPYGMRGLYKGGLETHKVQYNDHIHASRSYQNLVNALWANPIDRPLPKELMQHDEDFCVTPGGARLPVTFTNHIPLPYKFDYRPSDHNLARVDAKLAERGGNKYKEFIIVNPNCSDMLPHRRWDLDNYVAVCRHLLETHPQMAVVVTGMPHETEGAKYLRDKLGERILDLTGDTSMGELLALYTRCRLLITNDSGPAHFASIVDLPTVVLFGPDTPLLFAPLGGKCYQLYANTACSPCVSPYNNKDTSCAKSSLCMKSIAPAQVIKAAECQLGAK